MAPWWWFPCKPKHFGALLLILKCFNNSTFFNVLSISWKLECWVSTSVPVSVHVSYLHYFRPRSVLQLRSVLQESKQSSLRVFTPFRTVQTRSGAHPASFSTGTGFFPENNGCNVQLTTHFRLVPGAGMRGAIPELPLLSLHSADRENITFYTVFSCAVNRNKPRQGNCFLNSSSTLFMTQQAITCDNKTHELKLC